MNLLFKVKSNKKNIIVIITLLFFFIIIGIVSYYSLFNKKYEEDIFSCGEELAFLEAFKDNDVIEQELRINKKSISSISVQFATFAKADNKGNLFFELINNDNEEVLYSSDLDISLIGDNSFVDFIFGSPISIEKDAKYMYRITITNLLEDAKLTCLLSDRDNYSDVDLYVNNKISDYDIRTKVSSEDLDNTFYAYFITIIIFFIMSVLVYFLIFVRKSKIENIYLLMAIFLGLVYMFYIIPRVAPDESSHISTSYYVSNCMMGTETVDSEGFVYMRNIDKFGGSVRFPTKTNLNKMIDSITYKCNSTDTNIAETKQKPLNVNLFPYIFSSLGITIGRILELNWVWTFGLGRIINLLIFAFGVRYAIKIIPEFKSVVFLIGMWPMVIQQSASYSYDTFVILGAIIFTAIIIKLLYVNEKIKVIDAILFVLSMYILIIMKFGAYIPIIILSFWCLYRMYKNKNSNLKSLIFIILTTIIFVILSYIISSNVIAQSTATTATTDSENIHYTLSYILTHKGKVIGMIGNTLFGKIDFYLFSMVGSGLGWLDIEISKIIIIMFLVLVILASIKRKDDKIFILKKDKYMIGSMCLLSAIFVVGGMLLSWTTIYDIAIEGVQGRYFIPIIFFVIILLRNNIIEIKRNIDRELIYFSLLLQPFVVYSICNYLVR